MDSSKYRKYLTVKSKIYTASSKPKKMSNAIPINTGEMKTKWSKSMFRRTIRSMRSKRRNYTSYIESISYPDNCTPKYQFDETIIGSKLISNPKQSNYNNELFLLRLKKLPEVSFTIKGGSYIKKNTTWNDSLDTQPLLNLPYDTFIPMKIVSIPISKSRMTLEHFYVTHTAGFNNKSSKTSCFNKTCVDKKKLVNNFCEDFSIIDNNESLSPYKFQIKIQPKKIISYPFSN